MKITLEADYGLRVVLFLSKQGKNNVIEAKSISEHEGIPLRFLLKLLRKLIQAGIVKSFRGVNGGYSLNKDPKDITFKDVIEAIDGPVCVNRCLIEPGFCNVNRTNKCEIHRALSNVKRALEKELENVNFGMFIN